MSQVPGYITEYQAANMWGDPTITDAMAKAEGTSWKLRYYRDAHNMFSRVQHHVHEKAKQGDRPLAVCKSKRYKDRCTHDFPMDQRLTEKVRVVCRGNAARFGLRIKGEAQLVWQNIGAGAQANG